MGYQKTKMTGPNTVSEGTTLHEMMQERWADLVAIIFQEGRCHDDVLGQSLLEESDDGSLTTATSDSDGEESYDDDDTTTLVGKSVNKELSQLHFDLDITERSLVDLELEFAEDLKALAYGLEMAFDHFEEDTLQKQEARMSQSTRSTFKDVLESSLREKRTRRNAVCLPMCLDDFHANQGQQETEEEDFQNWFEKLWSVIEHFLNLFSDKEQEQQSPDWMASSLFTLWFGTIAKQSETDGSP
jgi:hypothetical protein